MLMSMLGSAALCPPPNALRQVQRHASSSGRSRSLPGAARGQDGSEKGEGGPTDGGDHVVHAPGGGLVVGLKLSSRILKQARLVWEAVAALLLVLAGRAARQTMKAFCESLIGRSFVFHVGFYAIELLNYGERIVLLQRA
jgi:hypothetical protein